MTLEIYGKVLSYIEETPSGTKYNEDVRVFIYDDGHIEVVSINLLNKQITHNMQYLYREQVRDLLKFLIDKVDLIKDQENDPEIDDLLCA